jgi:Putative zinc-finger
MTMPRPLDCRQVLEHLEAYVDGDLDGERTAAVAAHLESCAGCAAEWRLADDVRHELRALPAFDTPPEVLRAVFQQVGAERFRPPARADRRPAWAALAAAFFAMAVIGGGIFLSRETATPSEPAGVDLAQADPEEIARATEEARLAFAQVARVSRQAGFAVREDLGEHLVAASTRSLTRALLLLPEPAPASPEDAEPDRDRS